MNITLTIAELVDLAELAGLVIDSVSDTDSELVITECPPEGVLDDDDPSPKHYRYIAYYAEYPDEGVLPLGEPLEQKP
jgi:hypothetical protein